MSNPNLIYNRSQQHETIFTAGRECYSHIVHAIDQRLGHMTSRYGRTLTIFLTLTPPSHINHLPKEEFTKFINSFCHMLTNYPARKPLNFHYYWCLEKDPGFHWHCVFFGDANKIGTRDMHDTVDGKLGIMQRIRKLWAKQFGLLKEQASVNVDSMFLDKKKMGEDYPYKLNKIRGRCMYLAKINQKGKAPMGKNEHNGSRLSDDEKSHALQWKERSLSYEGKRQNKAAEKPVEAEVVQLVPPEGYSAKYPWQPIDEWEKQKRGVR